MRFSRNVSHRIDGAGAVLAAALMLAAAARAESDAPVGDVVRRVQERFDATLDFTAKVEQQLEVVSAARTLEAHGTVAFKRPGKMRWSLENDEPQIIVADGSTLWFYQPKEQQVLKAPFRAAFRSSTPVSFLTGVGRLEDDFEASIDGRTERELHLLLVPKKDAAEIGRLKLTVDAETYDILAAEIRDPLGNVTRLKFSDLKRNSGLPDSLFQFEVPPGVDVVEAPIGD